MKERPIILIGPPQAGKTTIAGLLAAKLGVRHLELDALRWDYYNEIGYDGVYVERIRAEEGFASVYRYWKPFEVHAVERVLADYSDGVISFGGGHAVYEDEDLFERAQRALAPYKNVILLMPCENVDEAVARLHERFSEVGKAEGFVPSAQTLEIIAHLARHPSQKRLARMVVYTDGKRPSETCEEVLGRLET